MNKPLLCLIVIALLLVILGCTAGPNTLANIPASSADSVAGFWRGLWHGIIAPITFLISLFVDSINLYEVHNNGGWYNFGFVLGAGILFGGGGSASSKKR